MTPAISPIIFATAPPGVVCRDRPAAYAVIRDDYGRVAVASANVRGRDCFWLPGGGMHDGESPEQTIVREIREELGRHVQLHTNLGQAVQFFYAGDDQCWYKMTAHFFAAELLGDAGHEGEYELQWVDPILRKSEFFHECHMWAATNGIG